MNILAGTEHSAVRDHDSCWCGKRQWEVFFHGRRFGLLYCRSCSCYRIDPVPLRNSRESARFYTEYYAGSKSAGARQQQGDVSRPSRFSRVVRQVAELKQAGEKAIDIGCGDGHLCAELLQSGWKDVMGIDVSATRIDRARRNYRGIPFFNVPIEQTDIPYASADLIIMDNVIEHLPDPTGILSNVRHYLKPGGRLVVITPNMYSGHFRLLGRRWTPELSPHTHIFLFTPAALQKCLEDSGYIVNASGNFHLETYSPGAVIRRFFSGDVKGAAWRAMQEMGALYGHCINSGPMLYSVAHIGAVSGI